MNSYIPKIFKDGDLYDSYDVNRVENQLKELTDSINNLTIPNYDLKIQELEKKIYEIENPFDISSFIINTFVAEKGDSINIILSWNYNKNIIRQYLNDSIVDLDLREMTFENVTSNNNYTLKAISESNVEKEQTLSIKFYNGIYYGKSNTNIYDSNLVNSLTKILSEDIHRTINVNSGNKEFIFYCIPSRLGIPLFYVNGFEGGFSKVNTITFTNDKGYIEDYDIYKSFNSNLGETTITIK